MLNKKIMGGLLVLGGLLAGTAGSIAFVANAQTTTAPVGTSSTTDTETKAHGHRPLGGDGIVFSINGTTIGITEESDEGGASYTVDASGVTNLPTLKVEDKVFVEGVTTGNSVKATSVSLRRSGHKESDTDSETNDTGTDSGSDQ